jgi:hypothetical protein
VWRTLRDIRFAVGFSASAHREKGSTWKWPEPPKPEAPDEEFDRDDLKDEPSDGPPDDDEPDEEADFGG